MARRTRRIWTAWPSAADLWGEDLEPARAEVAAMVRALWDGGRGDVMRVLAQRARGGGDGETGVRPKRRMIPALFGDIWFRDTGPIFDARRRGARFQFNGWGGKYVLPHDDRGRRDLVALSRRRAFEAPRFHS